MSKLDKDQVIATFTVAYSAVNGKAPTIEAKGGWYSVDGGKNMRLADLDAMTAELGSSTPVEETKDVVEKPEKAAKKKVAKTPAKKKVKDSNFSVKAFWAEKILKQTAASKLPRKA